MAVIEKLTPPVTKVGTSAEWDAEIARLTERRAALARQAAENATERGRLALAGGDDPGAAAALAGAVEAGERLRIEVENFDGALALAHRHRASRAAQEAAATRDAMLNRFAKAQRDRVETAKDVDATLSTLKRDLDRLLDASARADAIHGAALEHERPIDRRIVGRPFGQEAVIDLVIRRLAALGLAQRLGIEVPATAARIEDLADAIREGNRRGELTANGRVRTLNPEPPAAA